MMPVSLLIALLLAFGIEPAQTDVPEADVVARVLETCGGITLVAVLAFGLGFWVSFQVAHSGYSTSKVRRRYGFRRPVPDDSFADRLWLDHPLGRLVQDGAVELGPGRIGPDR